MSEASEQLGGGTGRLLDEAELLAMPGGGSVGRGGGFGRGGGGGGGGERAVDRLDAALRRGLWWVWAQRSRRGVQIGAAALALVGAGWGVAAGWKWMFPRATPNVAEGEIEDILDFTLMSDRFNQLSVKERLDLIKQLVTRLKGMSSDDSAMMAAFAAGISGKAREQMQENVEQLVVDVWAQYADNYRRVPPGDREAFLDGAFVEFTKMMEDIGGVESTKKDGDRIKDAKNQAKRDQDRMKQNDPGLTSERARGFFGFMTERGLGRTSPEQRYQMQNFQRDMVRHLRGQDLNTGKPKGGG